MANINVNIRMDSDLKQQFEAFCSDMGMTMSTAFNIFAKKTVHEYRIPFTIGADIPNDETTEAIREVQTMKKSREIGKIYSDVDTMMKELLADV
ncbi:MAG: type II toxin-antitoxin system RelB/DinJ family antitoxin [Lachnospiraceae bacterium]|nr:type II toxin-antitoxin system RelB/DinJ family antitoxin [Lachnospiraceae bacterium]